MSGVSKSTVGKKISKAFKYKFVDTDREIENKHGFVLQTLLDKFGDN